jgi:hypothetical protein
LLLDADEILTSVGCATIRDLIHDVNVDAYALREVTTVAGRVTEDKAHLRLFRRGTASISQQLHTEPVSATGRLQVLLDNIYISHDKTSNEQAYDDLRYHQLGF